MNVWSNLNVQISFKKRDWVITLPYLKGYYKSKGSQNNQQSRIESPEIYLYLQSDLVFKKKLPKQVYGKKESLLKTIKKNRKTIQKG